MSLHARSLHRSVPDLIALASGALAVLGFAPFSWLVIAPVAIAGLHQSLAGATPRQGFRRGWLFGLGLLGFGVFWIRISLNEFGNMGTWLAHSMTALFIASMALYYGLVGWTIRRLHKGPDWVSALLLLPGSYLLFEWLRGWLFTGFPWLALGYTQIEGPLAGYVPIVGVYGVSLLTALSGGLLWGLIHWSGRPRHAAVVALVTIWAIGGGLQRIDWTRPAGTPLEASVLQASVPQSIKWTSEGRNLLVETYLELTRAHLGSDLIVWPETALPDFLDQVRAPLIDPLAARARAEGTEIVLGIPIMDLESRRYYNGLISIGSHEDVYAKRHLVPFGEFMPFKSWLGPVVGWFEVPMSDFSPGANLRPLIQVGRHRVGVSICYEDAFPSEVAEALPEAAYLINISNDAWFGDSLAPHQHLEIARMRALETGRDLVRATNTGISAFIDHQGRLIRTIPPFRRAGATAQVQPRSGATPFVFVGNWLAIALAAAMVAAGGLVGRRRSN